MGRKSKGQIYGRKRGGNGAMVKRLLLWSGVAIITVITLGIVAWFQLLAYLQGNSFREYLCTEIRQSTGAEAVDMGSNLRITGDRVQQSALVLQGVGALETGEAERISAEVVRSALWESKLHIKKLMMEELHLEFQTTATAQEDDDDDAKQAKTTERPTAAEPQLSLAPKTSSAPVAESPQQKETDEDGYTIKAYQIDFLESKASNFTLRHRGKEYSLTGSTITAEPQANNKRWNITLSNGRLHSPFAYLRDCNIKSAHLTVHPQSSRLDVTKCRIMLSPGELEADAYYNTQTGVWKSELQLRKADLGRLLKGDWKKRITGEMFGQCRLNGASGKISEANGKLYIRNGVIEGLPFLSELYIDNSYPYRSLQTEKAECHIIYPYNDPDHNLRNAWLFDKINIRTKGGYLRIHGHIIIADDSALGGSLRIGIPQHIVARLPLPNTGILQQIFNATGEAGYAWININLSGTVDDPKEDLSVRVTTILKPALPSRLNQSAGALLNSLFKKATEATNETEQEEESNTNNTIIDQASDAVNTGLRLLF